MMWTLLHTVQFVVYIGLWQIDLPSKTKIIFSLLKRVVLGEFIDDLEIGMRIQKMLSIETNGDD